MRKLWHRHVQAGRVRFDNAGGGDGGNGGGGNNGGGGSGGGAPEFIQTIPESYRGTEWAKQNAKDPETFFKFVDNLNSAFGKKGPARPGENATPEDIKAFNKWVGVPDKPEDYEFANIDEMKDAKRDPEAEKAIRKIMHDAGIPKEAAKKLQQNYEKMLFAKHQEILAGNKKVDEAFDKATKDLFGDNKDTTLANARKLIKENVPAEVQAKLDTLPNDALIVLTSALDGIVKKYVKEDGFNGGGGAPPAGGETYEALSKMQRDLFASKEFTNPNDPGHQAAHDKNKQLMEKMRALTKK